MLNGPWNFVKGLAAGAGLMYVFDPIHGRRRRALLRDKAIRSVHELDVGLERALRDLTNRLNGVTAELEHRLVADHPSDRVLAERVRAEMGRHVSHPGAIQVAAHEGRIVLSGTILQDELPEFLRSVAQVRGVRQVDNQLATHHEPGTISSLQGSGRRQTAPLRLKPAGRLLLSTAGCLLLANCLVKRTPGAILLGTLGCGMFLRATTDVPLERLVEAGCDSRPSASRPSAVSSQNQAV